MERSWTETVPPESASPSAGSIPILSPGCRLEDRYELRNLLGIGGSGVVYAAFDHTLRQDVAIKVLRNDRLSPTALKRFRREVAVARNAQSPHLVRVFDIAESADSIFLTMELVQGESLARVIRRGPIPVDRAISIAAQVLAALQALHQMGIVHRDVKPSNVMITSESVVKLTDFGLAMRMESESRTTASEAVVGTYEYLSPEQALAGDVDERSDLYSFGILLFECLAGEIPLRSGSSLGTVIAHVSRKPPDIRSLRPETPRWLAAFLSKLLEKDPARRYQSAAAALTDLQRRRAPFRISGWNRFAALVAVVLTLSVVFALRAFQPSHFAFIGANDGSGGRVFDQRGRVLWSHRFLRLSTNATPVVVNPGDEPVIAAILTDPLNRDPRSNHRLQFLDPLNGKERDAVELPSASYVFSEFSDSFIPCRMMAVDLDHNGAQEIVVSYCHNPYFPSYSIILDPRRRTAFPVFIAAGHHIVLGQMDVDGDRRDELIFWGPSNRMGWYAGLAAVKADFESQASASTPNEFYSLSSSRGLLWYALVGDGGVDGADARIDEEHHRIVVRFRKDSEVAIGIDGFEQGSGRPEDSRERSAARERAYELLRTASRLSSLHDSATAMQRVDEAIAEADRARDFPLGIWARRIRVKIHIEAGAPDVESLVRDVMSRFDSPSDACWEAANAFHLRGQMESAIRWYREGMRIRVEKTRGRFTWEYLEGLVFAYAELGRWDDARQAIAEYSQSRDPRDLAVDYRLWLDWRTKGRFTTPVTAPENGWTDLWRYLALESAAENGAISRAEILSRIDHGLEEMSGAYHWILLSLKADQLARNGERVRAMALARQAFLETQPQLALDPGARAHFELIATRYARIARMAGQAQEADLAMRAIREFHRGRTQS